MGETCHEKEWAIVVAARDVVKRANRRSAYFVVVEQLVRNLGNARAGDARHVVVPPVDALIEVVPIGCPAEVGGVDVSGAAFFKAMELIRPDEVHLPGKNCSIAANAQVVRDSRDGGGQIGGVVEAAGVRWQLPGHHAIPRRCAQRAVGVRGIKDHCVGSEAIDVRSD